MAAARRPQRAQRPRCARGLRRRRRRRRGDPARARAFQQREAPAGSDRRTRRHRRLRRLRPPPDRDRDHAGRAAREGRGARIIVAMEPRSNSMRLGAHADALAPSLDIADAVVFLARPELPWDAGKVVSALKGEGHVVADADALIAKLRTIAHAGDHVVFMSNGGFDSAPRRFFAALDTLPTEARRRAMKAKTTKAIVVGGLIGGTGDLLFAIAWAGINGMAPQEPAAGHRQRLVRPGRVRWRRADRRDRLRLAFRHRAGRRRAVLGAGHARARGSCAGRSFPASRSA